MSVNSLILSAGTSFVAFLALLVLAAVDTKSALPPDTLNELAYALVAISLASVLWFCAGAWRAARRLGLSPVPWALLPLLTAPFGVWVACILLLRKMARG